MNPQDQQQTPISQPPPTIPAAEQPPPEEQRIKDEKYANALVAMANLDYKMQEHQGVPTKHFISKKKLVYLVVSVIITLLSFLIPSLNPFKSKDPSNGSAPASGKTTQDLINTTQELQDAAN